MEIKFEEIVKELPTRARAILGVPEEILTDEIISSPIFALKASKYINKKIQEYENIDSDLLEIAYIYYICYLLCGGMYARLPKEMSNTSTKTVLQSINWDEKALELLSICDETIDTAIGEIVDDLEIGNSFAVLTSSSEYPNTTI